MKYGVLIWLLALSINVCIVNAETPVSKQQIEALHNKTIEVMTNSEWDDNLKRFQLQPSFTNNIDFAAMADQVYEKLQFDLDSLERKRFKNLFKKDMIAKYWPLIKTYNEQNEISIGLQNYRPDDTTVFVPVTIEHDENEVLLEAEFAQPNNQQKITNIKINNKYLTDSAAEDYQAIFQEKGWKGLRRELERRAKQI